jgi:hypothetical protein
MNISVHITSNLIMFGMTKILVMLLKTIDFLIILLDASLINT